MFSPVEAKCVRKPSHQHLPSLLYIQHPIKVENIGTEFEEIILQHLIFEQIGIGISYTHYAVVQPKKVVLAPARYKTSSQPWPLTVEMPPYRPTRGVAPCADASDR